MPRELTLLCPCCRAEIVIDLERGKILEHRAPRPETKESLEALAQRAREKPRLQDELFGSALLGERERTDSLEHAFRRAHEDASQRGDYRLEVPELPAAESELREEKDESR